MSTLLAVVVFVLGLFVPSGDGQTSASIDAIIWYSETGEASLFEYADNIICYSVGLDWNCEAGDNLRDNYLR